MSEQGWREFLAADGVGDWVVLHGGPTAVFMVGSLRAATRLAAEVAARSDPTMNTAVGPPWRTT
ncbi:MAG TPA: hypothetical protein VNW68_08875, partial [Candidatus Limnocylindria bacterium]|nr:hypothetical protein [Candidatus Limnocylindria bacterium]